MEKSPKTQAAVVTVSDGVANGVRDDASGRAVKALLEEAGFDVARTEIVPDERKAIEKLLRSLSERFPWSCPREGPGWARATSPPKPPER